MRHFLTRTLCLALALLTLLTGQAFAADMPAITVTNAPSAAFRDPYLGEVVNKGAGVKAVCGQHTYVFPGLVTQERAKAFVAQAEAALAALSLYGGADRPLTIHLTSAAYPIRVDGDHLYMALSAFRSMDYVTALAQLWFGPHVVYGLLYAASCEAAAALGIGVEEVPAAADALPAFADPDGLPYADMNYACFIGPYASADMQANVRSLARDFFASLSHEERVTLLTDYSAEAFYARLNVYLASHGLPQRENAQLWGVSFHGGGQGMAVCWESEWASFAVASGYEDLYGGWWYGRREKPLVSSYADLIYWVEHFEGMLSWLVDRFGPYITFRKPLIIFDSDRVGVMAPYEAHYTMGYYLHREHTIHTGACEIVDHEFIHALIVHEGVNMNLNEIIAYTYSTTIIPQGWSGDLSIFTEDYAARSDPASGMYDPEWGVLLLLARQALGHWPDYSNPDDMLVMIDLVTCYRVPQKEAYLHADHSADVDMKGAKISFWHYLLRTYGEPAALTAALSDDPLTHLGRSWDALATEWSAWLLETYPLPAAK